MLWSGPTITLSAIFISLSIVKIVRLFLKENIPFGSYLKYTWLFFLGFVISEFVSFSIGVWALAILCFLALREYFSLIDIRLQDRLGILGAYLSIPFMFYFIQIDWYGMFIISIPVYSFLAVPLLVTLGGKESQGTVFSIGAIDFGLFLFVFCIGHIGYLLSYTTWMPVMLILNIAVCDLAIRALRGKTTRAWISVIMRYLVPVPMTIVISVLLSEWAEIPMPHSIVLGMMIPALVIMGHHTGDYVEEDLGIQEDPKLPGRGQILDNIKSLFFTAPVVFHYIRYFLK
jgi:phosphatidate cytidylyltransferase